MKPEHKKIYESNILDFGLLPDAELMGLTIYAEARGETRAGKIAVGTVILERVSHRDWDGKTIHEVCLFPKQFSCFNPDDSQRPTLSEFASDMKKFMEINHPLQNCVDIASKMISGEIPRDTDLASSHCCQYLTTEAKKHCQWWHTMRFVKRIGTHEFFAEV